MPCYSPDYQHSSSVPLLHTFPTTSVSDTCQLILKSPSTSCALDTVPTWLLKHIADDLAPFLTHLINSSITSGDVPRSMKHAIVTPVLKKANLDPDNLTNQLQTNFELIIGVEVARETRCALPTRSCNCQ